MNRRLVVAGLACAAMAATCGGDGSTFSSGVNKDAELGNLSSDDAQKLCQSLQTWMKDNFTAQIKEVSCRTTGFLAARLASGMAQKETICTTAYDECMKRSEETPIAGSCDKPPASCKATVGEFETCINEISPLMNQVLSAFPTCKQVAAGATPMPPANLMPPASCTSFQTKCPGLDLPSFPGGSGD
jgi:hypothetical protein